MIKKYFWIIMLAILLSKNVLYGKSEIIDWKILSNLSFNSAELFIDKDNGVFVRAGHCLWMDNTQIKIDQYGWFWNGFIKNGRVYLVFSSDKKHVDIYSIGKNIDIESHVNIEDFPNTGFIRVVSIPGDNGVSYLLGSREQFARNPVNFLGDVISGGHGRHYYKPILAEIRDQTLLKYFKIPYDGKIDESYYIKEVLTSQDIIRFWGITKKDGFPDTLRYVEYDIKKKETVQTQDIYEKFSIFEQKPDGLIDFYWHVSADNFNDNLFIVFSWNGIHHFSKTIKVNVDNSNSPIYYSQSNKNIFSLGNVHVIWVNSDGALVHKTKNKDKWSDEKIIMNGIDSDYVWDTMYENTSRFKKINAEFDKNNNLNVIFTSKGNLVLAKIRLN